MPAVFSSPHGDYEDIDWNPSTGTASNWELPPNNYPGGRQRHGPAGNGSQRNRNAWGVDENVKGGTWGAPAGTDAPASDARPFRDPFSDTHRHRQQQRQQRQHRHYHNNRSSRSLSTGRGEHHPMSSIGNMNGQVNDQGNYGHHNSVYDQQRRLNNYDDVDVEDSEDEPFYLEDQLGDAASNSNAYPHSALTRSQHQPYPIPYPWPVYPSYPPSHDVYQQQQIPYGYPPTIPPHSHPTTHNAAFFNTGRDDPKKKKKVHRRKSEDDLAADWGGNRNDFNSVNDNGWGRSNNDNDHDDDDGPRFHHRHAQVDAHNQGWGKFTPANDRGDEPFRYQNVYDDHRRNVSSAEWGGGEDDLEPDVTQIHANGEVNSGGGWQSSLREQPISNIVWGSEMNNNADSPGLEHLNRQLTDLHLNRRRSSSRRRHVSSPPDLVGLDSVDAAPRRDDGWGDPTANNESQGPYTQPYPNERPVYTNGSAFIDRVSNSPRRADHQSTYHNTRTFSASEDYRRRAYADAFSVGTWGTSGSGPSIGNGVASQLKDKAMKWLGGAGIGTITLHPILRSPTMLRPNLLTWDVRRKPNPARAGIPIGEAMSAFSEPASKPPLQYMLLTVPIPQLPGTHWQVDVYPNTEDLQGKRQFTFGGSPTSFGRPKSQRKKSSSSTSYDYDQHLSSYGYDYAIIQCADVLSALTRMLHMSATSHDYHALAKTRQKQVYDAFILRCREMEDPSSGHIFTSHIDTDKNDPEVNKRVERNYRRGLKRVDFLCGKTRWEGLEPNGVDSWIVKLGKSA